MLHKSKIARNVFVLFCSFSLFANDVKETTTPMKVGTSPEWSNIYAKNRDSLTLDQIYSILDRGIVLASKTDMVNSLSVGGTALFPHSYITECGDQIAAVVHASLQACKNTGKNQILLIGVLHSQTDTLKKARQREREENIANDPCRGIFGPGLPSEELLCKEYSLDNFVFLLEHAAKRNGIEVPNVVIRYPYLVYGQPELLPGIEALQQLAKESIVVATGDLCHHGTAYAPFGQTPNAADKKFPISQQGYDFAYETIEENLRLLGGSDLLAYRKYCFDTISDTFEVGQILRFLLGPLEGHIRDLKLVDVSDFFKDKPQPNWVAASLVELKSKQSD